MRLIINRGQLIQIQVGVALRRRKAGMTEQFLNAPQIGTSVQYMGSKAMTQTVGTHFYGNPRFPQMLLDHACHTSGRDSNASMVQKDRSGSRAGQSPLFAHFLTVVAKRP